MSIGRRAAEILANHHMVASLIPLEQLLGDDLANSRPPKLS
jgi:hypothetical protein